MVEMLARAPQTKGLSVHARLNNPYEHGDLSFSTEFGPVRSGDHPHKVPKGASGSFNGMCSYVIA